MSRHATLFQNSNHHFITVEPTFNHQSRNHSFNYYYIHCRFHYKFSLHQYHYITSNHQLVSSAINIKIHHNSPLIITELSIPEPPADYSSQVSDNNYFKSGTRINTILALDSISFQLLLNKLMIFN